MRALQAENLDEIVYVMFIFNILFNNIITVMLGIVKAQCCCFIGHVRDYCLRLVSVRCLVSLLMLLYYCSK